MKKTGLAISTGVLAVVLAACGNGANVLSNEQPPPQQPGTGAPVYGDALSLAGAATDKTQQAKSVKFTMEIGTPNGPQPMGEGQAKFDGANTAMAGTFTFAGTSTETRMIGQDIYIKVPEGSGLGGDKPWMKLGADLPGQPPNMGGGANQASQSDPTQTLEQIKQAGTIIKTEQTEVAGQPATYYLFEMDAKKLAEQVPNKVPADKASKFTMELWLNNDQLPVQIAIDMASVLEGSGLPTQGKVITKYTDWGGPVDIQPPPADQVGTMPTMPK